MKYQIIMMSMVSNNKKKTLFQNISVDGGDKGVHCKKRDFCRFSSLPFGA
jgi:hypothetical protein